MEWFIETRFGDPILSLDISGPRLVYGSALGQVGYVNLISKEQFLLTEIAEESIKGIHITEDNVIYASVGDLYVLVLFRTEAGEWHMEGVCHEGREHTNLLCGFTHVLQYKNKTCLLVIEEDQEALASIRAEGKNKLIITHSSSGENEEQSKLMHEEYTGLIFPKFSVPFYYNGEKLLWLQRDLAGSRTLKMVSFNPLGHTNIKYIDKFFGAISCPYIFQDSIIFIHNFKQIKSMDINTGDITGTLGTHKNEILAIFSVVVCVNSNHEAENHENNMLVMKGLTISVDKKGVICLWEEGNMVEMINLTKIEGISVDSDDRFFGMGYPYVIKAGGIFIVVTTDVGIIIVRSEYLKCIGGIDPLNNFTNTI
jgi:hypothetical protein